MKSRSASLTGASGFLGWHIAEALRQAGWHVRAVVRPGSLGLVPPGVERIEAALEPAALRRAFAGSDVVVHAAGRTRGPRGDRFDVNVDGTRAAVIGANHAGAALVHISSLAASGPSPPGRAAVEGDAPHPVNAYGRSKLAAERVVASDSATPWIVLRPGAVYGPRDRGFLPLFAMARRGRVLRAARVDSEFTVVHATDVAKAVAIAADRVAAIAGRTFFIGHAAPVTTAEMLAAVAAAVGRPSRSIAVPTPLLALAAAVGEIEWRLGRTPLFDASRLAEFRAGRFVCDTRAASDALGFTAVIPLSEGLAQTWAWYRAQGWV